jgi:cell division septal protein FtsQ
LLLSPAFRIRSVQADVPPSCLEIVNAAVPLDQNLLLFRRAPLLRSLRNDPLIADASVALVPPGTVKVTARLREAFMRVRLRHGTFDVDRQGVVFRASSDPALPLLVGASFSGELGGNVDPETMETVTRWLDAARRYSLPRIVKVEYTGGGKCNLALEDGRLLKAGVAERIDDKLAAAEALLGLSPRDQDYVDLELPDQPVIGWHRRPPKASGEGEKRADADAGDADSAPNEAQTAQGKTPQGPKKTERDVPRVEDDDADAGPKTVTSVAKSPRSGSAKSANPDAAKPRAAGKGEGGKTAAKSAKGH